MAWGWKAGLIISFAVFYLGFGLLAFAWDLTHGDANLQDVWTYVTFGKFVDYSEGFEKRTVDSSVASCSTGPAFLATCFRVNRLHEKKDKSTEY